MTDPDESHEHTRSYVIRVWYEPRRPPTPPDWRGLLIDIQTDEHRYYTAAEELVRALVRRIEPGSRPPPP